MKKKLKRSAEIKKLDRIFSKYIRLRDSEMEYGRCCTCGELKHYKEAHCGHFIKRGCMLTRFDERNCQLQCCGCNTYREGEQAKHLVYIEDKHGREVVDELMRLERVWKQGCPSKMGVHEIRELQEVFKQKTKELGDS
jgi:hypothetical protein